MNAAQRLAATHVWYITVHYKLELTMIMPPTTSWPQKICDDPCCCSLTLGHKFRRVLLPWCFCRGWIDHHVLPLYTMHHCFLQYGIPWARCAGIAWSNYGYAGWIARYKDCSLCIVGLWIYTTGELQEEGYSWFYFTWHLWSLRVRDMPCSKWSTWKQQQTKLSWKQNRSD